MKTLLFTLKVLLLWRQNNKEITVAACVDLVVLHVLPQKQHFPNAEAVLHQGNLAIKGHVMHVGNGVTQKMPATKWVLGLSYFGTIETAPRQQWLKKLNVCGW
jgi:hypothetical protein